MCDVVQRFVCDVVQLCVWYRVVFGTGLWLCLVQGCDGHTCIWDVRSGSCEMKFNQDSAVNAVKFFPSGDSVASAGNDGIVREDSGNEHSG